MPSLPLPSSSSRHRSPFASIADHPASATVPSPTLPLCSVSLAELHRGDSLASPSSSSPSFPLSSFSSGHQDRAPPSPPAPSSPHRRRHPKTGSPLLSSLPSSCHASSSFQCRCRLHSAPSTSLVLSPLLHRILPSMASHCKCCLFPCFPPTSTLLPSLIAPSTVAAATTFPPLPLPRCGLSATVADHRRRLSPSFHRRHLPLVPATAPLLASPPSNP